MQGMNLKDQGGDAGAAAAVAVMEVEDISPLRTGVMAAVYDTPLGTTGEVLRQAELRRMEGEKPHRS